MSHSDRPPALHRGSTWLIAVLILVGAAVVFGSASARGSAPRTLKLTELEKGSTYTHISNTKTKSPRANSQGDLLVFTNPLADASGKPIGKAYFDCTTTTGANNFVNSTLTCVAVFVLRDGTLMGLANSSPGKPTTIGAITGGTGAYANARGVLVSHETKNGSVDTITLSG